MSHGVKLMESVEQAATRASHQMTGAISRRKLPEHHAGGMTTVMPCCGIWWTHPLGEDMEQINTYTLFALGRWLDSCFLHARMPLKINIFAWHYALILLDSLIKGDGKLRLKESRDAAIRLAAILQDTVSLHGHDAEAVLDDARVREFNSLWAAFDGALSLDLGRAPVFFVTPKGIYSTPALINEAENTLADDISKAISDEAKQDLNQAGRCLAFQLATASGYHALRAVEKVLREYYEVVTGRSPAKIPMSEAIKVLKEAGADVRTMAVVDQIRGLHRNPVDHPELFLDPNEAMELFSICTSAISVMARQMMACRASKENTET